MKLVNNLLLFWLLLVSTNLAAAEAKVAKVIILKGEVSEYSKSSSRLLKKGDWVYEGRSLKSSAKSFVKLLFLDKSQMSLGPNSELKIKEFPRNKAGIINLIKGKIRAKVTKNYMEIDQKKSKLFIKTKSAAMGVRGTDFQVLFNPDNKVTSLLTFEGAVAMTKIDERVQITQNSLEQRLNGREAVMVRQGQYSGSSPGKTRVSQPVKISPTQLESLRQVDQGPISQNKEKPKKETRSMLPPGVDAKKLAAASSNSVDSAIEASVGADKLKKVEMNTQSAIAGARQEGPPPEGFEDRKTGAFAPASGGFIDDQSGLYIPPPEGSAFDANAGVYVPNPEVGSVDGDTGAYIAPAGMKPTLQNDKVAFVSVSSGGRGPASTSEGSEYIPKDMVDRSPISEEAQDAPDKEDIMRKLNNDVNNNRQDRDAAIIQTGRARVNFRISR